MDLRIFVRFGSGQRLCFVAGGDESLWKQRTSSLGLQASGTGWNPCCLGGLLTSWHIMTMTYHDNIYIHTYMYMTIMTLTPMTMIKMIKMIKHNEKSWLKYDWKIWFKATNCFHRPIGDRRLPSWVSCVFDHLRPSSTVRSAWRVHLRLWSSYRKRQTLRCQTETTIFLVSICQNVLSGQSI